MIRGNDKKYILYISFSLLDNSYSINIRHSMPDLELLFWGCQILIEYILNSFKNLLGLWIVVVVCLLECCMEDIGSTPTKSAFLNIKH